MADFDDLQASWDETKGVDDELFGKVAKRVVDNHEQMKSILDGRDLRELTASALVGVVFIYFAWSADNFYVWLGSLIVVFACIEVSAVLLWARRGVKVTPERLSVRDFTLHQRKLVRRQTQLLRHVAWWYLLPFTVGLLVMTYGFGDLYFAIGYGIVVLVLYGWIWKMNQDAIASHLQPLDDAYTLTLESLDNPKKESLSRSYEALAQPERGRRSRSQAIKLLSAFLSLGLVIGGIGWWLADSKTYPKLSPFSAVRWQDNRPEVQIDGQWYELVKIDDVSAREIIKYCRYRYLGQSRKRFEEDLVEVLSRMGHPPDSTSDLTVQKLHNGETVVLEDVEWTRENRNVIKSRNDALNQKAVGQSRDP